MDIHVATRETYIVSCTRNNERLAGVGFIPKLVCTDEGLRGSNELGRRTWFSATGIGLKVK